MKSDYQTLNRQQFCLLAKITAYQFAQFVTDGMPVEARPANRGGEYRINVGKALAWLVERTLRKSRDGSWHMPVPAGAQVLADVDSPVEAGMVMTALEAIYSVTWFARYFALDQGCTEAQAEKTATGTALMMAEHFHRQFRDLGLRAFQGTELEWLQLEQFWWVPGRGLREDLALPGETTP